MNADTVSDIFKTPKPRASSTVKKARRDRSSLHKVIDVPSSSKNVISPNDFSLDNFELTNGSRKRLEGLERGSKLLKQTGLPAHYFNKNFGTPSLTNGVTSESTVEESDLLKPFIPTEVSTPRSSSASDIAASLQRLKNKLEHSDISLSKLCGRFSKVAAGSDLEDESFVTGDLAVAKIFQQEQSWFKERGEVGHASVRGDSLFSQLENCDMTDFFRKKSELADLFLKDSPEKDVPTPLVDVANKSESIFSYTAFENADTTAKIFDLLRNAGNKENIVNANDSVSTVSSSINILTDTSNIGDKSLSSVRTASSLDHLVGGKLPIETNRTELVWGCTQVGKRFSQNFIVRNKSLNKLHFQITSSNVCFRILTDQGDSDAVSALPVLLYPAELRCFKVIFVPTTIGAFVERLTFTPISDELKSQQTKRQTLMLYGYGGHAHIDIFNVAKDSNMKMWLSLGKFDSRVDLIQKFTVRNMGSLSAFICFNFTSKVLFGYSKVVIDPAELVIMPKSSKTVTVTFTPTKSDVRHMFITSRDQVIEIGSVHAISGAEPLRGRIRNISKKLDTTEIPNALVVTLSKPFPNEKMPLDIQKFTETASSVKELMQNLVRKEIVITIERDTDSTMLGQVVGIDETSFHSFAEGMLTMVANKNDSTIGCFVEPTNLVLTLPIKTSDCILLISHQSAPLQFQTSVSVSDMLLITPAEGIVSPEEIVVINVACNMKKLKQCQRHNQMLQVLIHVDNDVFEINVKIIFLKTAKV